LICLEYLPHDHCRRDAKTDRKSVCSEGAAKGLAREGSRGVGVRVGTITFIATVFKQNNLAMKTDSCCAARLRLRCLLVADAGGRIALCPRRAAVQGISAQHSLLQRAAAPEPGVVLTTRRPRSAGRDTVGARAASFVGGVACCGTELSDCNPGAMAATVLVQLAPL
jgi:hypothetical protein